MSEVILTEENFDQEVLQSNVPVMAEWCGPCKVVGPIVSEIAKEYEGKIKVGKLNVDDHNSIAMRYNIMSIPTLKFFKSGNIVGEVIGAAPKDMLVAELQKHL